MAKNSLSEDERKRLAEAIRTSHLVLARAREERAKAIKQYVGSHYSDDGSPVPVPINLIGNYVRIVGKSLVSKDPRVMLSTFVAKSKPVVSAMQDWINERTVKMNLQETLHRTVVSALFPGGGIVKVGLATPADSAGSGWNLKGGEVFVAPVDFDDWAYDIHANTYAQATWMAHRYRAKLSAIKDSKIYSKARRFVEAGPDDLFNKAGDERVDIIGKGTIGKQSEDFEDHVTLWEVYIPGRRLVLTLLDRDLEGEPLRETEWIGPDTGPYIFLGFDIVPNSARPKSPIEDLMDLHLAANNLYRKIIRQAERFKQLYLAPNDAQDDAETIRKASDGDMIRVSNPATVKPIELGGANPQLEAMARILAELFNQQAGNLNLLGGLAAQSATATQDKILNSNSSRQISDMQDTVISFTTRVYEAMAWYYIRDPRSVMRTTYSPKSYKDFTIERRVTPQDREEIDPDTLKLMVDPHSMTHSTPQERGQQLISLMQQIIAPMMGLLQQQGVNVNMNAFLNKLATYLNMPDLPEIINLVEPPTAEGGTGVPGATGGAGQDGAPMPASTTRNYVRESRSTQTDAGAARNAMAMAVGMSKGGNPQESAA